MLLFPSGVDRPLYTKPYVSLALMGINALITFVCNPLSPLYEPIVYTFASRPGYDSLLTLFTQMFLHDGFGHLLGNIIFFVVVGVKLEDALGHWRFLLFYLACGVAANAAHTLLSGSIPVTCLGASGAIAGVLGGFMILYPRSQVKVFYYYIIGYGVFRFSAWIFLGCWFLLEVISLLLSSRTWSGVAFGAHIGGFAAGAIWMWAFYGWNRGPDLDEEKEVGPRTRVIVAPTMQQEGGGSR